MKIKLYTNILYIYMFTYFSEWVLRLACNHQIDIVINGPQY